MTGRIEDALAALGGRTSPLRGRRRENTRLDFEYIENIFADLVCRERQALTEVVNRILKKPPAALAATAALDAATRARAIDSAASMSVYLTIMNLLAERREDDFKARHKMTPVESADAIQDAALKQILADLSLASVAADRIGKTNSN